MAKRVKPKLPGRKTRKVEFERKEFGFVNLVVEKTDKEVKIWACDSQGINVFRLKAIGIVHAATIRDIIVTPHSAGANKIREFRLASYSVEKGGYNCIKCKEYFKSFELLVKHTKRDHPEFAEEVGLIIPLLKITKTVKAQV